MQTQKLRRCNFKLVRNSAACVTNLYSFTVGMRLKLPNRNKIGGREREREGGGRERERERERVLRS